MKTIKVTVTTDDGKDNSATNAIVEQDRGAGYIRMSSQSLTTNKDKEIEFKLRQGQRLVIEAYQPQAVVYDRDQGAAYAPASQASSDGTLDDARQRGDQNAESRKVLDQKVEAEDAQRKMLREQGAKPGEKPAFGRTSPNEEPLPDSVRVPAQSRSEQDAKAGIPPNQPRPAPASPVRPGVNAPINTPTPTTGPTTTVITPPPSKPPEKK